MFSLKILIKNSQYLKIFISCERVFHNIAKIKKKKLIYGLTKFLVKAVWKYNSVVATKVMQ